MANYKIILPSVDVPTEYTHYSRDLVVKAENPKGNKSEVLLNESAGASEESWVVEVPNNEDIIVSVDLKNNELPVVTRQTSGKFYEHDAGAFWIIRTDEVAPAPEPEPAPEPTPEPDPEPVVEPDPEPEDDSDNSDTDDHWENLV